jgi:hypothetical protein
MADGQMLASVISWGRGVSADAGGMESYKVEEGVSNVIFTQERVCWQRVSPKGKKLHLCSSYFYF